MKAVIFAAKSTEDKRDSIPDQLSDCRALAGREGHEVVAEFNDEAVSAYKKSRGPGLAAALSACERLATEHGHAALIVQHSDRLARGDAKRAKHLVEYGVWAIQHDVKIYCDQDPDTFRDLPTAANVGQRNYEDSARKSKAVRSGLRRRRDRGEPVGRMSIAYRTEPYIEEGEAKTRRVLSPNGSALVLRMVQMVEAGHTPGSVARTLNREGIRTRPTKKHPEGKQWTSRAVRGLVLNPAHVGEGGYPPIEGLDLDLWRRAVVQLTRMDPAAVERRKGGRNSQREDYLLRGVAFCFHCGLKMYTRQQAIGRVYICRAVRQCEGTCDGAPVPAELIENEVLSHLSNFVGDVEEWLGSIASQHEAERKARLAHVEQERVRLFALERERESIGAHYRKLLGAGDERKAEFVLDQVTNVEAESEKVRGAISDAEASAAEWIEPSVDDALDAYNELVALVRGRVSKARGAAELNAALHDLLAGVWVAYGDEGLHAEFKLRSDGGVYTAAGRVPPPMQTGRLSFVYDQPVISQISAYE